MLLNNLFECKIRFEPFRDLQMNALKHSRITMNSELANSIGIISHTKFDKARISSSGALSKVNNTMPYSEGFNELFKINSGNHVNIKYYIVRGIYNEMYI